MKDILGCVYEYFLGRCASAGAKGRGEFYTHQSVDKLVVEMLEPMNRRVYGGCRGGRAEWSCRPSGSLKAMAASAELLPTSDSSPHTCPSSSASYPGPGLVHSSKTGTTVTYTLSHPVVVDLLTVAQVMAPRGHQRPDRVTDRTANRLRRPLNAPEQG